MSQSEAETAGGVKKAGRVSRVNDVLATRVTFLVGTMWAFYAFMIFGLTPLLWPAYEEQVLYWSNFLQLIFLPIITVGSTILSRNTVEQAEADHEIIGKEFDLLQRANFELTSSLKRIDHKLEQLLTRNGQ